MKIRHLYARAILPVLSLFTFETAWAGAPSAGDLPLDQFLRQQHYGPVTTEMDHGYQVFHAKINGQDLRLQGASEDAFTCLTRMAAWNLGLKTHDTGQLDLGLDGRQLGILGAAPVDSFTIQNWAINRERDIKILPRGMNVGVDVGGSLGFDDLKLNSAIVMAGRYGFLIRPGILTPAPIDSYMRKEGYVPVPLKIFHQHLVADGTLEGTPFVAVISCDSALTYLDQTFVTKLGLHVSTTSIPLASVTAKTLTLGPFRVSSQQIFTSVSKFMDESQVQASIGKDFLSLHEAIIDCGSSVLWIK